MSEQEISEVYANHFQNSEPKFYTRVPNIIDHLTYEVEEDGNKIKKRLSVHAKELYRVIRMIASDYGTDWHTTENLAEIVGCSVGMIHKAKEELLMPMDQLDKNPLIIENRKQITKLVDGRKIKTILCTRTIVDIWPWNNAFMATIKHQNRFGKNRGPDSPHESGGPPDSPHESAPRGPDSCGEANKISSNNIPLSKEQQPTASAEIAASFIRKNKLFPSEKQRQAYEWMIEKGCKEATAYKIAKQYSPDDIQKASEYTKKRLTNGNLESHWAYFHSTLQNKYWLRKKSA